MGKEGFVSGESLHCSYILRCLIQFFFLLSYKDKLTFASKTVVSAKIATQLQVKCETLIRAYWRTHDSISLGEPILNIKC